MPKHADRYHQWLSIPPKDQPPDHYRLLGLARFEASAEAIARAAEKRLEYLHTFQVGADVQECERLRSQVEHARTTLLDPRRKAIYDALLRTATSADAAGPGPESGKTGFLKVGQSIGRFLVLTVDRETRLAATCTVEYPAAGRVCSLKMLSRQAAGDERLRKRFEREVEISLRLNHSNLVTGHEAGEHDGIPYLVSEHVIGTDLQTVVGQCGPFPADQAIELVEQAACGLGQLHVLGVFHRNVSPRNLVLDIQGRVRVSNLLLAGIEEGSELDGDESLTQTGEAMGSSDFMAIEQAADASAADQRADVYSLGCTLFYLLTDRVPYGGRGAMEKALAHRRDPIPSLQDHCPDAPAWLDRVFQKMVAKQPEDRYQSMAEVSRALLPGRSSRGLRRRLMLLGGVGLGVLFAAVLTMAIAGWLSGPAKMPEEAVPTRDVEEAVQPSAQETSATGDKAGGEVVFSGTTVPAEEKSFPSPDAVVKSVPTETAAPKRPMPEAGATPGVRVEMEAKPVARPKATPSAMVSTEPASPQSSDRPPSLADVSKTEAQPVRPSETSKPPTAVTPPGDHESPDSWLPPLATSEDAKKRKWPYVGPVPNRIIDESKATYFVSVDGSDENDGHTRKTAFATMQRAANVVKPGETVLVTKGVYHAGFHIAKRGTKDAWITFVAEPGAEIRGTEVRRDWQREGGDLPVYSVEWRPGALRALTPDDPLRDRMEQVFSQGQLLQQVPEFAALRPRGTFFVENDKKRLHVCLPNGKDPNNIETEVTTPKVGWPGWAIAVGGPPNANWWKKESIGLQNQAAYVRIDGFTVRNIANFSRMGAIQVRGLCDHILVENCDVQWANHTGIAASSMRHCWSDEERKWIDHPCHDVVVRNCIASNNGCLGMNNTGAALSVLHNVMDENNYKNFNWTHAGGAIKMNGGNRLQMCGNVVRNNCNGGGLWFDYGGEGCVIEDNFVFNAVNGLHDEVTPPPSMEYLDGGTRRSKMLSAAEVKRWKPVGTTIRRNVVSSCKEDGVFISSSCNAQVYNNVFYANAGEGICFGGSYDRPDTNGESGNRAWSNICDGNNHHARSIPDSLPDRFFDNLIGRNLYGAFQPNLPFTKLPFKLGNDEVTPEQWCRVHTVANEDTYVNGPIFRRPEQFDFTLRVAKQATRIGFDISHMRLDWSEFAVRAVDVDSIPGLHRLVKSKTRTRGLGDCVFRAVFDHDATAIYSDGNEVRAGGINAYCFDAGQFVTGVSGGAIVPARAMLFPVPEDFPATGQGAILLRLNMDDWRTEERKVEKSATGWHRLMRPLTIGGVQYPWSISFDIDEKTWSTLTLKVETCGNRDSVDVTEKIKPGRWFQVLINWFPDSRNPKGPIRRLYLNGQLLSEKLCSNKLVLIKGPMYIGAPQAREARWKGAMDQVRIYRRAFTDQEIQQLVLDLDTSDKPSNRQKR